MIKPRGCDANKQNIPRTDTGLEIVRECGACEGLKWSQKNAGKLCTICGGTGKIPEPLTLGELVEVAPIWHKCLNLICNEAKRYSEHRPMNDISYEGMIEVIDKALTFKGGRIRRKV